ncbi:MAG: helix-turn-helix transcriptional regulator [Myxococcota bacterium]
MSTNTTAEEPRRTFLTYREVSEWTGIPRGTWQYWFHIQRVPHIRLGPRLVRFRRADVEAFLESLRVPASDG